MHVFQLHLCAAKKLFSLHSMHRCIAQLFKITFRCSFLLKMINHMACEYITCMRGEWPSGLYSLRQVTEVKLGRVRSDFGWVTSED